MAVFVLIAEQEGCNATPVFAFTGTEKAARAKALAAFHAYYRTWEETEYEPVPIVVPSVHPGLMSREGDYVCGWHCGDFGTLWILWKL